MSKLRYYSCLGSIGRKRRGLREEKRYNNDDDDWDKIIQNIQREMIADKKSDTWSYIGFV